MKSIQEFLLELSEQDIRLWLEGNSLRCNAPKDILTVALRDELTQRKTEIISFLSRTAMASGAISEVIPLAPSDSVLPLSLNQQGLWFIDQLEENLATYNQAFAVELKGDLNVDILERSLQEIIFRHAILRTNFVSRNGRPIQVIQAPNSFLLAQVDISHLIEVEQLTEIEQFTIAELQHPFDLAQDQLFRVSLLHRQNESHVLLFVMHHLIADGWSSGVIMEELGILYKAFLAGKPSPLPEPSIQYADFAYWQQQQLEAVLDKHLNYWLQKLDGAPPLLQLPTDRPRQSIRTNRGKALTLELGVDLTRRLRQLSQQNEVTLFTLLLSAFQVLLHRYTNETDLCIGTPIANRDRRILESLVGFFVNTVVIRTQLSGNLSFRDFLKQAQEVIFEAQNHKDLPFHLLVEKLQPQRDLSYTPLFQVVFVLETLGIDSIELADLTFSRRETPVTTAKFDLNLAMQDTEDGLIGRFEYNTDLFDAATIRRMMGHLQTLLTAIAANPDQRLSDLPLLTSAERRQLAEWNNNTSTNFSCQRCIHELFEEQVEKTPDAIAIVFGDQRLTYRELNQRSNQLANYLQTLGIGSNRLVGICLERSLELVIGFLAILKAGGAYVPLDPAYPQDRLNFMLFDAQVTILLTQQKLSPILSSSQTQIICLDADVKVFEQASKANPTSKVVAENLAYVIYTSGSTGKPKGVLALHQGLLNLVFWHCSAFEVTSCDRATQLAGLAFDASVWEIYPYLITGATLYLAEPETLRSPENLQRWLLEKAITIAFIPTPFAEVLLSLDWSAQTALRTMLVGGDKLRQYPSKEIPFTVVNNYGPTENTVVTTSGVVVADIDQHWAPPIGRAINNVQLHILDEHLQPVPVGIPGELYISGTSLTKGYLNRPELTKKSFISGKTLAHLTDSNSSYFYKTGDLVRYQPDGNVEFLGRIDHQVKLRGFRIELGEIEAALTTHPAVEQAVVSIWEDEPNNQKLVAYLVYQDISIPNASELKQWLRNMLPGYMIPSIFVSLESIPFTPNGKIDRRSLPEPDANHDNLEESFAPRNAIEETIAEIWAQVLGIRKISVHDNFFELGGHSLVATQIITRIATIFGIELSLHHLFETPTVAELAITVKAALKIPLEDSLPPIQPSLHNEKLPLSFAQTRLLFLQKLQPDNPFYNIAVKIQLQGVLNTTALERSLNEIVRRHSVLRSRFCEDNNRVCLTVVPFSEFTLFVTDLQDLSHEERAIEIRKSILEVACKPFNLYQDRLLRLTLLRLEETNHLMLLTLHHSIADGWSVNILMRELEVLYTAFSKGISASLPTLPVQYTDFAIWQQQYFDEVSLKADLDFWKNQLNDAPSVLNLPSDYPRSSVQTFAGSSRLFRLPGSLARALKVFSQQSGVTLFMTLLTAFQILLYRYTGMADILVGTPVANRNRVETEPLIGCFVNTLVLRTNLLGDPSFQELLERVREVVLGAYAHQSLPFERLLEELHIVRSLSHTPLFQVMFSLHNTLTMHVEVPDLTIDLSPIDTKTSKFDLSLDLVEHESGLMGRLEYNTNLFKADRMERLIGHFEVLLESIVAAPSQRISELYLLTTVEKQLLSEWNNTQVDFPHNCDLHELFEAQAEKTPDAVAVVFDGQQLTYDELNRRADCLAYYLQTLNIKPDTLVGICLERSLDMLVGLLGILKAGAAYLPLDPSYPKDRLSFIVLDSQISVLLTQQHLLSQLPDNPTHVLCLDTEWDLINQTNPDRNTVPKRPDNLAYVIYTSGSTGQPKGVKVTHKNVVNFLVAMQREFQVRPSDILLSVTSISFDIAVLELFLPLITGARVVIANRQVAMDGQQLSRYLTTSNATFMQATPATWRLLLASGWQGNAQLKILCGGEALSRDLANQLLEKGTNVWNLYGPTETTIWSTVHKVDATELLNHTVAIGRPIGNTQVYVLASSGHPVPLGIPGELHIAGMGVAQGYLNRPKLTAEKFVSHPQAGKLYKTGDLVRFLPNGTLEYLGRGDHQIKLRGFRIELGEIESTLVTHPAVQEAVVVAQAGAGENKRLIGYVVPVKDLSISDTTIPGELQPFLGSQLPAYMVPSAFVVLDAFPLTPNGKIDRLALPQPNRQAASDTTHIAPKTSIERKIASAWQEILQLEGVSVNDNFFNLGGHSLLLVEMQLILNKELNQNLEIVHLFQYPTIKLLANYITQSNQYINCAQKAQDRITNRQERQSAIAQTRQMRKQYRATHTSKGGVQ
ncbi:MAG TPA: amino acid adenylation domain-containing protein [Elainellaceae cyanobacterium]